MAGGHGLFVRLLDAKGEPFTDYKICVAPPDDADAEPKFVAGHEYESEASQLLKDAVRIAAEGRGAEAAATCRDVVTRCPRATPPRRRCFNCRAFSAARPTTPAPRPRSISCSRRIGISGESGRRNCAACPGGIALSMGGQAEALTGIALCQLVQPGCPVVFGSFLSNTDMQSGSPSFGTPESAIGLLCTARSRVTSGCRSGPAAGSPPRRRPTPRAPTRR